MQFSTKIDGFEQKDSQGFENSYNSYEQYPLEKFLIFTIYQNYTLALKHKDSFGKSENLSKIFFAEILVYDHDYEGKSSSSNGLLWISFI